MDFFFDSIKSIIRSYLKLNSNPSSGMHDFTGPPPNFQSQQPPNRMPMNMPPHVVGGRMPPNMPPGQMMQYPPGVIPPPGGANMFQDRPPHFGGSGYHQQQPQFGRVGGGGPPLSLPHQTIHQQQIGMPPNTGGGGVSTWEKPS
jgi:hypothetical protein